MKMLCFVISLEFQFQQLNSLKPTLGFFETTPSKDVEQQPVPMDTTDGQEVSTGSSQFQSPPLEHNWNTSSNEMLQCSSIHATETITHAENGFHTEVSYTGCSL